jgi:hypothetical protein
MTFAAMATGWAWLLLGSAAGAAAILFLIRPRPPRHTVAALLLWDRVLDARREDDWWHRIRRIVSLAATVLIAAAIAGAIAGPAATGAQNAGRLLIVLDSSWTMNARSTTGRTRWADAVDQARALAASNAGPIAVATPGDWLVQGLTNDVALVDSAIARLAPTGSPPGTWPHLADATEIHVFTDGGSGAPAPGAIVHSVFAAASNVAVTAFDVRQQPDGADAEGYFAIANYADAPQPVQVTLTRGASMLVNESLAMRGGEIRRQVVPLPIAGDPRFRLRVAGAANDLDLDDEAAAWLPQAAPMTVGIVGHDPAIARLLDRDRGVRVERVAPTAYPSTRADIWIFDRWVPDAPPGRPALLIDPPAAPWLGAPGVDEAQPAWPVDSPPALLDGVDPAFIRIARAHAYAPAGLEPLVTSVRGTPLVSRSEANGRRLLVLHFALEESNLPDTPAFPTLVANAVDWLGRPWAGVRRTPGPVVLPPTTTQVVAPDGHAVPLIRGVDHATALLRRPGLYLVDVSGAQSVVTVALDAAARSDLRAAPAAARSSAGDGRRPSRAWWPALAALALLLACLEWVTWQRRLTV